MTPWARAKVEAMYLSGEAKPARKKPAGPRPRR